LAPSPAPLFKGIWHIYATILTPLSLYHRAQPFA
jgi:hypothetical protein